MKPAKPAKPKKPRDPSVVAKHDQFVNDVLDGTSHRDAARKLGYSEHTASNLMQQDEIKEALAAARADLANVAQVKRIDMVNVMLEAIDMARTMADPANMINGAREISKMMGFYAPEVKRVELTGDAGAMQHRLRNMTDEELFEIAAGRMKVIDGEAEVVQ